MIYIQYINQKMYLIKDNYDGLFYVNLLYFINCICRLICWI